MTWWKNNQPNFNFWRPKVTYQKAIKKHNKERAEMVNRELVTKEINTKDLINKPEHYHNFTIEPSDFIMTNRMSFWKGNIIKYASRAGLKLYDKKDITQSEVTDLKKCIRYCEMRINQLEGKNPNDI